MSRQMQSLEKRLEKKRSNSQYLKGKNTTESNIYAKYDDPKSKILNELADLPNIPRPKRQAIVRL